MTQTPEHAPEDTTAAADDQSPADMGARFDAAKRRWMKSAASTLSRPRTAFRTIYTFMNELSRDHTFWLHMMAVRSGAAMTVLAAAGTIAYAVTLPFALAATVVVGVVVGVTVVGVGIVAGTQHILRNMRRAYDAMKNGETADPSVPPPPPPPASDRPFYRVVNKVGEWPVIKAVGKTRQWKMTEDFIRDQKKWMLGGTALGGAAVTAGTSAWVLAAQVAVLPVVALGSAVSFVALMAAAGVISGCAGLYFGTKSLIRWHKVSKAEKAAEKDSAPAADVAADAPALATAPAATKAFDAAAKKETPAHDDTTAANENTAVDVKATPVKGRKP